MGNTNDWDMAEKRICQLPSIRCCERTEIGLMRLAARDGRDLSDYLRRVLEHHLYGHACSLDDGTLRNNVNRARQGDA